MSHSSRDHPALPAQLPKGTYILNNGPKKKGQGGRFTMGDHGVVKNFFNNMPGVRFTEKPEEADYVIVPEGVTEPGSKIKKRNPSLSDPRVIFSMDQLFHIFKAHGYGLPRQHNKHSKHSGRRRKKATQYSRKDPKTGETVSFDVPSQLDPTGRARFLNPLYFKQLEEIKDIPIKSSDYIIARNAFRADQEPVVTPQLHTVPPPQPTLQQAAAWTPPPPSQNVRLMQMIQNANAMLDQVQRSGPDEPLSAPPGFMARPERPGVPDVSAQVITAADENTELSPFDTDFSPLQPSEPRPVTVSSASTQINNRGVPQAPSAPPPEDAAYSSSQALPNIETAIEAYLAQLQLVSRGTENFSTPEQWAAASVSQVGPDKANDFFYLMYAINDIFHIIWQVIYQIKSGFRTDFLNSQPLGRDRRTLDQQIAEWETSVSQVPPVTYEEALNTVIPDAQLINQFPKHYTLDNALQMLQLFVGAAHFFQGLLGQLSTFNEKYRALLRETMIRDQLGTKCAGLTAICVEYHNPEDPEQKQKGGEGMHYLIRALFDMSCKLFADIGQLSHTETIYQQICNHAEGVAASANDMHNYLFYQGAMGQNSQIAGDSSAGSFCANTDKVIDLASDEIEKLDRADTELGRSDLSEQERAAQEEEFFSSTMYKWNLRQCLWFLQHVGPKPAQGEMNKVYEQFTKFMLGADQDTVQRYLADPAQGLQTVTRSSMFAELRSAVAGTEAYEKKTWLVMYFVAITLVMANLCQNTTGYNYKKVAELLYAEWTPDHNMQWVLSKQERGKVQNFLSNFGWYRKRYG